MKVAFGSDEYTPLTDAVCVDLEARGHSVVRVPDGEWAEASFGACLIALAIRRRARH